jgi:signal transduction histidine kinase
VLTSNNAQALMGMAEGNAFLQIQALVASTVKDDADVVYGTFMMADSSLPWAVSEEGDSVGKLAKADSLADTTLAWVAAQKALSMRTVVRKGQAIREFAAPVGLAGEPPMGWIRYGLSTHLMELAIAEEAQQARIALMQIIGLLIVMCAAIAWAALGKFQTEASRLSKPVTELAAAAEIIKGGDYRKPVEVASDDEIGDLVKEYNKMVEKLGESASALAKSEREGAWREMARQVAHEIKNPLTSIKTFAEYLPKKYDDPGFREKFSRIVVDEVDRVNNIVKQLLEFSKPKELELRSESITGILDDTLGLLNNNLIQNKIEVVKNYKDSPVLPVDKNQLKQAFLNLFLNSIQAMPNGGTLTVSVLLSSDLCSLITISDTGSGIPKDQLDHVFDPFFSTKEGGTGLGLSIVHGIITKHGGKISVESIAELHTTFTIALKYR